MEISCNVAKLGLRISNRMGKHFIQQNLKTGKKNVIIEGVIYLGWLREIIKSNRWVVSIMSGQNISKNKQKKPPTFLV
jgi:hypothetical protein